jgi:hypothetical protein
MTHYLKSISAQPFHACDIMSRDTMSHATNRRGASGRIVYILPRLDNGRRLKT